MFDRSQLKMGKSSKEHDVLILDKNKVEEDLTKLKISSQAILQKYEVEAHESHRKFETQYIASTPEARQRELEL